MRIAVAQLQARDLKDRDAALEDVVEAIGRGARAGANLVVAPECAWPAYVIGTDVADRWADREQDAALARIAEATRKAGVVSVVGLALADGRGLHNVAVVHETSGERTATVGKRFLWDVDTRWFCAADTSQPVGTSVGRLGILVCADGRMPEIARSLALEGAQILLDPTAWVTAGADPATWTNPQFEFMLPTRAWENRLPAVAANKAGVEESVLAYCGRSVVLGADGNRLASARSDGPDLLIADVDLPDATTPRGNPGDPRHAILAQPTESLPAHGRRTAQFPLSTARPRVVAVPGPPIDPESRSHRIIEDLGAALTVTAEWPVAPPVAGEPFEVAGFGVSVLGVEDLDGPEAARAAMLGGADLLVWRGSRRRLPREVLRSRAAENRVYLVALDEVLDEDAPWGLVIGPDGNVINEADARRRILVADLQLAEARTKEMAPGTDVVTGRQPGAYGVLVGRDREDATA